MIIYLLVFIATFILVYMLLSISFIPLIVEGDSMSPGLMHGDRVLVFRDWPVRRLQKGQIIIVTSRILPDLYNNNHKMPVDLYVKRVAALEGEKIVTRLGDLHEINRPKESAFYDEEGERVWSIPPKHIFVCGDNLPCVDSRIWGPLPVNNVLGVVVLKLPRKIPS